MNINKAIAMQRLYEAATATPEEKEQAVSKAHDYVLLGYTLLQSADIIFRKAEKVMQKVSAYYSRDERYRMERNGRYGDSRRVSAKKGYDVGRNHETGRKIVEMAESTGLPVIEKVPLRKVWKGKDGKITHGELVSLLNGSLIAYGFTRTNQEERDSALLAIDASGIPMRMRGNS